MRIKRKETGERRGIGEGGGGTGVRYLFESHTDFDQNWVAENNKVIHLHGPDGDVVQSE